MGPSCEFNANDGSANAMSTSFVEHQEVELDMQITDFFGIDTSGEYFDVSLTVTQVYRDPRTMITPSKTPVSLNR